VWTASLERWTADLGENAHRRQISAQDLSRSSLGWPITLVWRPLSSFRPQIGSPAHSGSSSSRLRSSLGFRSSCRQRYATGRLCCAKSVCGAGIPAGRDSPSVVREGIAGSQTGGALRYRWLSNAAQAATDAAATVVSRSASRRPPRARRQVGPPITCVPRCRCAPWRHRQCVHSDRQVARLVDSRTMRRGWA
jgi:hypothetical protein